jgi:DNA primase
MGSTPVEQIKSRLNIVDIVGGYVRLNKAGSAYKALCPFHSEKSPSFTVSPTRQAFHCFGCNKGGDMFTFIEEIEGLDFPGALKVLAEKAGVELKKEDRKVTSERERWYSVMETATRFYESRLSPEHPAYAYLTGRGLTEETIKNFRIGFAPEEPDGWRALSEGLRERGIKDEEIEKVGLAKKGDKGYYDRFRSRIMFPISDTSGRVIAFSGRIFPPNAKTKDGEDFAKYVNSPETPLYDKSVALFGFDKAKTSMRKQNFVILVEGQMDLIMSHQAGTENTVAVSGTALTEHHLGLIKRLTPNLVFAFDSDKAGVAASTRAFSLALALEMQVRVAALPGAKDPADLIRDDKPAWEKAVLESTAFIPFLLGEIMKESDDALTVRKAVEDRVLPYVAQIRSSIEQAHFILEISRVLGIPDKAVWESLGKVRLAAQYGVATPAPTVRTKTTSLKERLQEEVVGLLLWQESEESSALTPEDIASVRTRLESIIGHPAYDGLTDADKNRAIFRVEQTYDPTKIKKHLFDDLLIRFDIAISEEKQANIHQQLARAEQEKDKESIDRHTQAFQDISKHIHTLKEQGKKL